MVLCKQICLLHLVTENILGGPEFYEGHFHIDSESEMKDTFISFRGWTKGVAFVNDFNIGRFWPVNS
jgi:hypothetical protein